jgi:hypothetical protein
MDGPQPISLDALWETTTYLPDRTPLTESSDHFGVGQRMRAWSSSAAFRANLVGCGG